LCGSRGRKYVPPTSRKYSEQISQEEEEEEEEEDEEGGGRRRRKEEIEVVSLHHKRILFQFLALQILWNETQLELSHE
jgi:hypothetical protein